VSFDQSLSAAVDERVVVPAQQRQPTEVGTAAVGPMIEVMNLARPRWGGAGVEAAMLVAVDDGPALRFGGCAPAPADIQRL